MMMKTDDDDDDDDDGDDANLIIIYREDVVKVTVNRDVQHVLKLPRCSQLRPVTRFLLGLGIFTDSGARAKIGACQIVFYLLYLLERKLHIYI